MFARIFWSIFARIALAGLVILALPLSAQAKRVALLIGNSQYNVPSMALRNPVNDVTALGAKLRDLGFVVIAQTDQDAVGMKAALSDFEARAAGAEMAMFFYAGHGVQIGQENNLVGVEFAGGELGALRRASITMSDVRAAMTRAAPAVGVLMLDACRDNPFSTNGTVRPGLAPDRGGAGLLIAYATDPGNVAYDGTGQNSVFTTGLLNHIATPGLDARLMLGRVRQEVVLDTGGRQIPWVEESVLGEHSFAPGPPEGLGDATSQELARWRTIASSPQIDVFQSYLRDYPDGLFAQVARDQIDTLSAPVSDGERLALAADADPERLGAALSALGLFDNAESSDVQLALAGYQRQLANPRSFSTAQLYDDAARVSIFLAATTLQKLRTDIVALRSVKRTLKIAEDALSQIAAIAETNEDAQPILREALADVNEIRRARGIILRRLDQSRSYYDEVLIRSARFFPPDASLALLGNDAASRSLGRPTETLTENAALFLHHVAQADTHEKGSYQWLADIVSTSSE